MRRTARAEGWRAGRYGLRVSRCQHGQTSGPWHPSVPRLFDKLNNKCAAGGATTALARRTLTPPGRRASATRPLMVLADLRRWGPAEKRGRPSTSRPAPCPSCDATDEDALHGCGVAYRRTACGACLLLWRTTAYGAHPAGLEWWACGRPGGLAPEIRDTNRY